MGKRQVQIDHDIAVRRVKNPLVTYAQFVADVTAKRPDAGMQRTHVNLVTAMGGFVRFYGNEAECRACAVYKALYEASQLGGARAVDPGREPVDGGYLNPEGAMINGADARRKITAIDKHLGLTDAKKFQFVVVGEWGPTPYAKWRSGVRHPNSAQIARGKVEIRAIAARVATLLKLEGEGGSNRRGVRVEGDIPSEIDNHDISTRKAA